MWLEDDSLPDHERALRRFDHDRRFGPAIGMTRSERWQRAAALGLEPPPEVLELLQKHGGGSEACLWEGRV
jgi:DNA polymerase delta subunit 4